jgi:hypothetical protein
MVVTTSHGAGLTGRWRPRVPDAFVAKIFGAQPVLLASR